MSYKKKKVAGLLVFSIGFGILLAVTMPLINAIPISNSIDLCRNILVQKLKKGFQ